MFSKQRLHNAGRATLSNSGAARAVTSGAHLAREDLARVTA
jgi:hypothetical protein